MWPNSLKMDKPYLCHWKLGEAQPHTCHCSSPSAEEPTYPPHLDRWAFPPQCSWDWWNSSSHKMQNPRAQSWDPCWIQPTQVKGLAWPGVHRAHLLEVTVPSSVTAAHPAPTWQLSAGWQSATYFGVHWVYVQAEWEHLETLIYGSCGSRSLVSFCYKYDKRQISKELPELELPQFPNNGHKPSKLHWSLLFHVLSKELLINYVRSSCVMI